MKYLSRAAAISVFGAFLGLLNASNALAGSGPRITELSADLEMKDFHDTANFTGSFQENAPITLTFKNNTIVKLIPLTIDEKTVRIKTLVENGSGNVLYDSTFYTKYNADAELSEKNAAGDLLYRLKLNPHIAAQ